MKKIINKIIIIFIILIWVLFNNKVLASNTFVQPMAVTNTGKVYINGTFDYKKAYECLELLNAERRKEYGAGHDLVMDKDLLDVAMQRAAESAILFKHDRPDGTDYKTLFPNKLDGENIYLGNSNAKNAIDYWMNSPIHKGAMLDKNFKSVGIGYFKSSDGISYWVQNFGKNSADEPSYIPENYTKEIEINTNEDIVPALYWKDAKPQSWKPADPNYSIELKTNESITEVIRCENRGTPSDFSDYITIKNKSFNWKSSNTNVATVDGNGKITAKNPGTTTITATIKGLNKPLSLKVKVNEKLPFTDVKEKDWFYDAVGYTYRNNIIAGYNKTTFAPNDKLTRGMIVTILYRMEGSPNNDGKSKFSDVPTDKYYSKAVKWAVDKDIIHGYAGTNRFGPNDNIIRQDLAAILKNYAGYQKKNTDLAGSLYRFSDERMVGSYAYRAMQWAVAAGVITGNTDGTLNPKGNASRAEAAAMIQKYCNSWQLKY